MSAGWSLLIGAGVFIAIGMTLFTIVYRSKSKDKVNLPKHWNSYLRAVESNDIQEIERLSWLLLGNVYLNKMQLQKITAVINEKIKKYPRFEELRLRAFNKKLHHDTPFPYPGSSGGVKQSW